MATPAPNARVDTAIQKVLLGFFALAALLGGLLLLPPELQFDPLRAASAIAAYLPVTLPAAVAALVAASANFLTAGLLMQAIFPSVGRSFSAFALAGFAGAVLLDLAMLYVLGGVGLFNAPMLIASHVGVVALAWGLRRSLAFPVPRLSRPDITWVLLAVVWSAPILLQLASPIVPFNDVLPNHVAPVEHLRTFGQFNPLTTSPSPIFGPSRLSLGYVGLLGTLSTLTGLHGAEAASAFIAVEVGIVALAIAALARMAGGRGMVFWALIAFATTQPFARLADDRARLLAISIVVWAAAELLRARRRNAVDRDWWQLAVGLGAALTMHAVIGAFFALALAFLFLFRPRHYGSAPAALIAGSLTALPQAGVMLGLEVPPLLASSSLPLAAGAGFVMRRLLRAVPVLAAVGRVVAVAVLGFALVEVTVVAPALSAWLSTFAPAVPLLGLTGLAGLAFVRPPAREVLVAMLGVGVVAGTAAYLAPNADDLLWRALRYEIPKEVHSWLPVPLAIGSGAVLAFLARAASRVPRRLTAVKLALAAAILASFTLPVRIEPIGQFHVGERRLAENLAIQLRLAEHGFWTAYPDPRWLIDRDQQQLVAAIRLEIASGRITADSQLLHIASSYRQTHATPVGVFTGVLETVASPDASITAQTAGGRLVPMESLDLYLAAGYDYLLVEPDRLPTDLISSLIDRAAVRYELIFSNDVADLFRLREGRS